MTVSIIEDDETIRTELSKLLSDNGFETVLITDFEKPAEIISENVGLVLLDVNLPFENGYGICRKIKQRLSVPVIFVTARNTDEDELKSIKAGGIDFISKPYNKTVLLEKIMRAKSLTNPLNLREINKNGYTLDLHLSVLKFGENEAELTRNEFRILYYFFTSDKKTITKSELMGYLFNDKYYLDANALAVNINRLRKKAEEIGIPDLLKTVYGKGYEL